MSNEPNDRELLSAYFDAELAPEESRRAEQRLEDSIDARLQIDEIGEMSELVKSLPTETAPPELLPAVMRRIERETLLPKAAVADGSQRAPASRKTWLTAALGIAATAAAVVLCVQFLPPGKSNSSDSLPSAVAVHNAERAEPAEGNRVAFGAGSSPAEAETAVAMAATADTDSMGGEGLARSAIPAADDSSVGGNAAAPSLAATDGVSSGLRENRGKSESSLSEKAAARNAVALKDASPGDVTEYFAASGTEITTYVVTVVDIKRAFPRVQVLLARNGIRDESAADEPATEEKRGPSPNDKVKAEDEAQPEADDRLFAIYVKTTPDRFTAALKEMLHDELVTQLDPKGLVDESQIEVADLGQASRRLFDQPESAEAESRRAAAKEQPAEIAAPLPAKARQARKRADSRSARPPAPTAPQDAAEGGKQALAKNKPGGAGKADAKDVERQRDKRMALDAPLAADGRAVRSYQMQVQLAPRTAAAERRRPSAEELQAAGNKDLRMLRQPQTSAARAPAAAYANETGAAPVRVLFVFRQSPRADEPQQ